MAACLRSRFLAMSRSSPSSSAPTSLKAAAIARCSETGGRATMNSAISARLIFGIPLRAETDSAYFVKRWLNKTASMKPPDTLGVGFNGYMSALQRPSKSTSTALRRYGRILL